METYKVTTPVKQRLPRLCAGALIATVLSCLLLPSAWAEEQSADNYYEGKDLTVFIASNPGGGTDTAGRLVANHWSKTIPGNPQIRTRNKPVNVIQGNYMQTQVRPDGLTVGVFAGGGSLGPVARDEPAAQYDPREWGIVGSIERGPTVLVIRKSALDRLTDPDAEPVAIGSVSTDRPQDAMAVIGGEHLDWNVKFVLGYPSSSQMYLAFERGEIDMFGSGTGKNLKRFFDSGEAVGLAAETRRVDFPDIPTFEEVLGDKKPDGVDWKVFRSWTGPSSVDKYFVTPPGTPDDVLQTLRTSFTALADDPEFMQRAEVTLGDAAVVMTGEETAERIKDALDVNPEVQKRTNELREKYGLPLIHDL